MNLQQSNKIRCFANNKNQVIYQKYHDEEWGVAVYDDSKLFEALVLETLHSGLSFEIVLKKRNGYKKHFYNFNPLKVALMQEGEINKLLNCSELIRHKAKMHSIVKNAKAFVKIQKEFGSFKDYIWSFTNFKTIVNNFKSVTDIPKQTELSVAISKNLKAKGMVFIGPVTVYSYLQAIGIINDHIATCHTKAKQ